MHRARLEPHACVRREPCRSSSILSSAATAATFAFAEARDVITECDAMESLRLLRAQLRGVVLPGGGDRGIGFEPARA